jgi:hypothetical protein
VRKREFVEGVRLRDKKTTPSDPILFRFTPLRLPFGVLDFFLPYGWSISILPEDAALGFAG